MTKTLILQNTTGDMATGQAKQLADFTDVVRDDRGWFHEGSYTAPNWWGPTPFTQWVELRKGDYLWELTIQFSTEPDFTWMGASLQAIDDRLNDADAATDWNGRFAVLEPRSKASILFGSNWVYSLKGTAHVDPSLTPLRFAVVTYNDLGTPAEIGSQILGVNQL